MNYRVLLTFFILIASALVLTACDENYANEAEEVIEFLGQFESIFVPQGYLRDGILHCWRTDEPINTDLPHFSVSGHWHGDRFGNEIVGELLPFIRDFEIARFIAINFRLYDLGYGNMPAIVVAFSAMETWGRTVLYRYIDGEYTEVSWGTYFGFSHDDYGNVFVFGDHGVMHIDDSGNIGDLNPFDDNRSLTTISHLPDLRDEIRQIVTERHFSEIAR